MFTNVCRSISFKIYFFFLKNTDHFVSAICMETLIYSPNFSSGLRTTNRPTHLKLLFNVCIGMNQINLIIAFWWSQYMFNRPSWEYIDLWRKQTFHSSLEMKLDVSNIKNLQRYNHNNIKFIWVKQWVFDKYASMSLLWCHNITSA